MLLTMVMSFRWRLSGARPSVKPMSLNSPALVG